MARGACVCVCVAVRSGSGGGRLRLGTVGVRLASAGAHTCVRGVGPVKEVPTRGGEAAFERFDAARWFDLRDRVHPVGVADSPHAFVCDRGV